MVKNCKATHGQSSKLMKKKIKNKKKLLEGPKAISEPNRHQNSVWWKGFVEPVSFEPKVKM